MDLAIPPVTEVEEHEEYREHEYSTYLPLPIQGLLLGMSLLVFPAGCGHPSQGIVIRQGAAARTALVVSEPTRRFEALDNGKAALPPGGDPSRPTRIILPNDVRSGYVLPLDQGLSFRLETEEACSFRCRLRRAEAEGRVRCRILLHHEGSPSEVLADAKVPVRHWKLISVEIPRFGTKGAELEIRGEGVDGNPRSPVLLANPEILQETQSHRKPSLLLISVDTLRRDHMSCYGYSLPTSPSIDHWAAEKAVIFDQDISAASWTLPSHVSMLTGLDAAHHGINHDVGRSDIKTGAHAFGDLDLLSKVLRRSGWATAAWTGGAYLHEKFGFAQGFDRFQSWPDRGHDASELTTHLRQTLGFLKSHRNCQTFVFLHTYAVHDPYRARPQAWKELFGEAPPPSGRIALFSPKNDPGHGFRQINELRFRPSNGGQRKLREGELEEAVKMYDSGIRYVDDQLGSFFDEIRRTGLDDNLIVVLTSDHGEAFGEGERFGHIDLSDDVLRVPLFISFPDGRMAGGRIAAQISSTDIYPTLLEYLGITTPDTIDGRSLLSQLGRSTPAKQPPVFSLSEAANRGLSMRFEDGRKLIFDTTAWADGEPRFRMFDLRKDPLEIHPTTLHVPQEQITTLLDYLDKKAAGLRLELVNDSDREFSGKLSGSMIRPVGTKSLRPDRSRPRFDGIGKASFLLPAGESLHLSFEKVFGSQLRIDASGTGGYASLSRTLHLRRTPYHLGFDGKRWINSDDGVLKIRLEWHGGDRSLGEVPLAHNDELRKQLRALGYLQ